MDTRTSCPRGCTLIALIGLSAATSTAQVYSAIELDSLGGPSTVAEDINASGQVVGYSDTSAGVRRAVRWNGAAATDLGTLGGPGSTAHKINDAGQVLGYADVASGDEHLVVWNGTVPTDVTVLVGTSRFRAADINEAGTMVGLSIFGDSAYESPAAWNGLSLTDLGGIGVATALNDAGTIVGALRISPHAYEQATLWRGTVVTDLGASTGTTSSRPHAINDAGQVVGSGTTGTSTRAFLWSGGSATQLGALGGGNSDAADINDIGLIVGASAYFDGIRNVSHATLWDGGEIIDLHSAVGTAVTAAVTIASAAAINRDGWIAANATTNGGPQNRAFLLLPLHLEVSPRALSFGARDLDSTSAPLTIALTNNGATSFAVGSVPVTGDFTATNRCGTSLAAGASCGIEVTFRPQVPGERAGQLTVGSGLRRFESRLIGEGKTTVSLIPSASSVTVGAPFTLSWSSSPGSTCTALGGAAGDGWSGSLGATGSRQVFASATGTYEYGISCTLAGVTASTGVAIVTTIPTATLSAAPPSVTVGRSVQLTWSSTNATTCVANGGQSGDGWAGEKPTSGTMSVPALAAATITYTIICSSPPQSAQALAQAIATGSSGGGGGGSFDLLSLGLLLPALLLIRRRTP